MSSHPTPPVRPTVVVFDPWDADLEPWSDEREGLAERGVDLIIPSEAAEADVAIRSADVVVVTGARRLDADRIAGMDRCIGVLCRSIGMDSVDAIAAASRGLVVTNVPGYCTAEVSDHALALLLVAERRIVQMANHVRSGGWGYTDHWPMDAVHRLDGQILGIVGVGRIGRMVATKARVFGYRTIGFDPIVRPEDVGGVEITSFDDLLRRADAIVICAALTPRSKGMFDREAFGRMKPGVILVNVARGGFVDEAALLESLQNGVVGQAGLDVRSDEPPAIADPLRRLPNVILTPHVASASIEAERDLRRQSLAAILELLDRANRIPSRDNDQPTIGQPAAAP